MSIFAASLLSMAGVTVAVIGLIAFLGTIALRRCEHKDVPAVLEALGTLARAFGRAPAPVDSRRQVLLASRGPVGPGRAAKGARDGSAPFDRTIEH
jgi:hypothetical protein